jgi:hypothetical protein
VPQYLPRGWYPAVIAGSLKCGYPKLPLMLTSNESVHRHVSESQDGRICHCLTKRHDVVLVSSNNSVLIRKCSTSTP